MSTLIIPPPTTRPTAEILLLLVAIIWGTSYGITKEALLYISVFGFLTLRFGLSTLLLLPFVWMEWRSNPTTDWKYAIPTGIILLAIFIAETYGITQTTASNAAFLISLCLLFTPFIEWLIFRQRPSKRIFVMVGLSLVGVSLLSLNTDHQLSLNRGDAYILLAALLRGCMVVATKKLLHGKSISSLSVTAIQSSVVFVGALLLLLINEPLSIHTLPTESTFWLLVLYVVCFCTIFAFFAQNYGVRKTSATRASVLMGSEPAFGAMFAIVWLGESLSLLQLAGGVLIVIATLLASVKQKIPH
ncbi:DMT family transporter [Aliivibrio kagoshimensis]|uniref:DMT family transporter n=1 Tax=Aliivibrio kagoshimensis TaxID=2910230 RepID=UPI003D1135D3